MITQTNVAYVNYSTGSKGNNPGSCGRVDTTDQQRNGTSDQGAQCRNNLQKYSLSKKIMTFRFKQMTHLTFLRSQPDRIRIAKSPILCGTS
jgi:hypothetical protein